MWAAAPRLSLLLTAQGSCRCPSRRRRGYQSSTRGPRNLHIVDYDQQHVLKAIACSCQSLPSPLSPAQTPEVAHRIAATSPRSRQRRHSGFNGLGRFPFSFNLCKRYFQVQCSPSTSSVMLPRIVEVNGNAGGSLSDDGTRKRKEACSRTC